MSWLGVGRVLIDGSPVESGDGKEGIIKFMGAARRCQLGRCPSKDPRKSGQGSIAASEEPSDQSYYEIL